MTKKKAVKKEVKEEVVECPVVAAVEEVKEVPVVNIQIPASVIIVNLKAKLQAIPHSMREIDIAVDDVCMVLDRALALCNFIESAQAELAKKKR